MRSFLTEFPNFPTETMPQIPSGWQDASYRNDAMPFFIVSPSLGVWIDYPDPDLREFGGTRFMVVNLEDGQHPDDAGEALLETDDWAVVLEFVNALP